MQQIEISLGNSRNSQRWTNSTVEWSALCEKLQTTTRTAETVVEYRAMERSRQQEVKDVGGFVGGYVLNGKRLAKNVLNRSLICLDVDFGGFEIWTDFLLQFGAAAVMHTTHKHTPDSPRFRIVILLSRVCDTVEYFAASRFVAGVLGIDKFDPTTFDINRLMFWPSTSKDGEFRSGICNGAPLDIDRILNSYTNYRDESAWPMHSGHTAALDHAAKTAGAPLEKPGKIGIFNRMYTISEAIAKYLPDVYVPGTGGRYSYASGSSANGLVVYENDTFAYSNHGTDPAGGKLCNAFDLVRLHLFGDRDDRVDASTPVHLLPSYRDFCEFLNEDADVKKAVVAETMTRVNDAFKNVPNDPTFYAATAPVVNETPVATLDAQWTEQLETHPKTGLILPTINNCIIVLQNDPYLAGRFRLNQFTSRREVLPGLPWARSVFSNNLFNDTDIAGLNHYFERVYNVTAQKKIEDALTLVYEQNAYHPVKNYLNGLPVWDGTPRVDTLLIDYSGAKDTEYTRAVTRKSLVACVNRIFEPGCKMDYLLTLVGEQGDRKSTLFALLAGKGFFSDNIGNVNDHKSAAEMIQGVWIIEIAELASIKRSDVSTSKAFISREVDEFRPAYGRNKVTFPRQCVFFATVNEVEFLKDITGNRRYWPVTVDYRKASRDIYKLVEERDQIWAEVLAIYKAGEPLFLSDTLETAARIEQSAHVEKDDRELRVASYISMLVPENWATFSNDEKRQYFTTPATRTGGALLSRVTTLEIWECAFGLFIKDADRFRTAFISNYLTRTGWRKNGHYFERKENVKNILRQLL